MRGERGFWELLHADDLVIDAESEEDAIDRFRRWKTGMKKRGKLAWGKLGRWYQGGIWE